MELLLLRIVLFCCVTAGSLLCLTRSPPVLITGLDAELSYVRNDVVNHYALSFNLLIPSETNNLHFSWHAKSKVSRQSFCVPVLSAWSVLLSDHLLLELLFLCRK